MRYASILGTGMSVPKAIIKNEHFSSVLHLDTTPAWILEKTGIAERRMGEETCSQLAIKAAQQALRNAKLSPDAIDQVILATSTPDMQIPSSACLVQHALGLKNAIAYDMDLDCAGFVAALVAGASAIESGRAKHVLVIGSEQYSRLLDWNDRRTCILFGDGAGAVVFGLSAKAGIHSTYLQSGGDPTVIEAKHGGHFEMKGADVYTFAVNALFTGVTTALKRGKKKLSDVSLIVPHQSNQNILNDATKALGIPKTKMFSNIRKYGNTAAASVPIALHEAIVSKRIKRGDWVCLAAYGAGPAWGSVLLKY